MSRDEPDQNSESNIWKTALMAGCAIVVIGLFIGLAVFLVLLIFTPQLEPW